MKRSLLALLLALCMLCLSGCSRLTDGILTMVSDRAEASGADALARQFIDGVLTNDPEKSHAAFVEDVEMAQVLEVFPAMQAALPDTHSYTLTPTHWSMNAANGVTQTSFQFLLTMGDEQFLVETLQLSTQEGLYNINIAPCEAQDPAEAAVHEHPLIDAIFMLVSVATAAFVIWALVDCCRHKMPHKWVWVLLILLGNVLLVLSMTGAQLKFNLHLGLSLNATSLTLRDGGFHLRLLFPVGSIVYLLRRRHLLPPDASQGFAEAFPEQPQPAGTE